MVAYKDYVLASDMTGGFYSLRYDDSPLPLCADAKRPKSVFSRKRSSLRAKRIYLRGNASDKGCSAAATTRKRAGRDAAASASRSRARPAGAAASSARRARSAARATARRRGSSPRGGRGAGACELRGRFPKGTYEVSVRARDKAGNPEPARRCACAALKRARRPAVSACGRVRSRQVVARAVRKGV